MRMTIPEILKDLEAPTKRFPKRAMQAAIEQREAITPELLRVLEDVAASPQAFVERQDYMLHLFAMFLLAQFREKRAYPLIVKIVGAPGETPDALVGDTITEGLKQILGSVYDGDPGPLRRLVEDATVNEYVRSAAMDAFVVLVTSGQVHRDEVVAYFRSLFSDKLERKPDFAWDALVSAVADLPAPELLKEVRKVYAERLTDPSFADLDGTECRIGAPDGQRLDEHGVITDAIAEMEWWACFNEVPALKKSARPSPPPPQPTPPVRQVKAGRNDPCPCGSGKKWKKCCAP
jgi:hypothetical protein